MPLDHVQVIHAGCEAFNRRDLDGFLAHADPDVEFTPYVVALEGNYHGHDGVRRWWEDLFDVFPDWQVEVAGIREFGDRTLATLHARGHGGGSETPVDQYLWQLATWSADGKLAAWTNYADETEALEAAESGTPE
jgi:ketosteroid isomerase-like protein